MAKKKFGVSETLSVQPKQLSPDEVEKAIQQIHQPPTEKQPIKVKQDKPIPPSRQTKAKVQQAADVSGESTASEEVVAKSPKAPKPKKAKDPNRRVRLSVDVSKETHKRLKIRAIERDSDIMHYVEMLIEKDLAKK